MTVRELIKLLLNFDMSADVAIVPFGCESPKQQIACIDYANGPTDTTVDIYYEVDEK